jgi:hypothetical protein
LGPMMATERDLWLAGTLLYLLWRERISGGVEMIDAPCCSVSEDMWFVLAL